MNSSNSKHEFALYLDNLSRSIEINSSGQELIITNEQTVHRITHVLRLASGESLTVFDRAHHALCSIKTITKKSCIISVIDCKKNNIFTPPITFLLPLLKRDALETIVYSLVELGVSDIQLIKTAKIQRSWAGKSEYERLQKIIISAAEQSKNYSFPSLHEPQSLAQAISQLSASSTKLYADPEGISLASLIQTPATQQQSNSLALMIGPEGDLSEQEKAELISHKFVFCALTPTILRSIQAGALFAGIMRSLYR